VIWTAGALIAASELIRVDWLFTELLLEFVRGILIPDAGVNLHVVIPCEVFRSIVVPKACFVLESLPTSEKRRAAAQSHARRSCSARQPSCDTCSVTFACLTWFE